ncbi:MAG: hypothetical protein HY305_01095 [Sphingobacteriales bacterium]|nr:hypothetical protein [Sphingobacteriales bacterium]
MKKDIEDIDDIKLLVDSFYNKVIDNELLAHYFNDIAKVNWEKHLPVMYSFWQTVLFSTMSFKGNPIVKHIELDKKRDEVGSFKVVNEFLRPVSRREAYHADITYGTNNEFGFDLSISDLLLKANGPVCLKFFSVP